MKLVTLALAALLIPTIALAGKAEKKAEEAAAKRAKIDAEAKSVLDDVLAKAPGAKALKDRAYGWAGFDNTKVAFGISGGGGSGVAVQKDGKRTYMKTGTAGIGFGLGAQNYRLLLLFETKEKFDDFIHGGWQGGAGASAVAGEKGANAAATFHMGVAAFVVTEEGLMANADLSGTKYWQSDKLND